MALGSNLALRGSKIVLLDSKSNLHGSKVVLLDTKPILLGSTIAEQLKVTRTFSSRSNRQSAIGNRKSSLALPAA